MSELILVLDQGTSSTKACVFEPPGRLVGRASVPVKRWSAEPGWTEHDPFELIDSCHEAAAGALLDAAVRAEDLAGVALANVGESFLLFDVQGRPMTPVIGWQDTRCGAVLDELIAAGAGPAIEERTGLKLHAEFSAPKLAHQLRGTPESGMRFGTLDTWMIHQLSTDNRTSRIEPPPRGRCWSR